jgi:para-nitrobenzyl esterase
METDRWYRMPAIRLAEAQLAHTPNVWMYQFAWRAPALGACHGIDQPFVFDNFLPPETPDLTGPHPPEALADAMHGAWVAFGRRGDPQIDLMPAWPRYDQARRATMRLDVDSHVVEDPDRAQREAWAGVL